jgi:spermidine/putrescine transport system ATP-binding protein
MLEVIDIYKSYAGALLLKGISFRVDAGETICLLGSSGSGKSTLLRIIAGLEQAESGSVGWDGQDLSATPAHLRNFGLVFQDYALFPHLNVTENVAYGLKMRGVLPDEIAARTNEALEVVNLHGFERRRVTDLSGGEQQRVALARALAPRPRLLMFDEPLGALDRSLREQLLDELRNILHNSGIPAIYVTHDQEEAFALADRILLLHEGLIVRNDTPAEVYARPGSAWAAEFMGLGNVLAGRVLGQGCVETSLGVLHSDSAHRYSRDESVSLLIRPEAVCAGEGENSFSSRVADVIFVQQKFKVTMENDLYFYLSEAPDVGQELVMHIPSAAVECLA